MTDRPSIEQQVADVIYDDLLLHDIEFAKTRSKRIADAIIAAVNDGTVDPIVPEGADVLPGCTCPWDVHYPENRECARFGL